MRKTNKHWNQFSDYHIIIIGLVLHKKCFSCTKTGRPRPFLCNALNTCLLTHFMFTEAMCVSHHTHHFVKTYRAHDHRTCPNNYPSDVARNTTERMGSKNGLTSRA